MRDLKYGMERERGTAVGMDREENRSRGGSGGVEREQTRSRGGSGGTAGKGGAGLRLVGRGDGEDCDPREEGVARKSGDSAGRIRGDSGGTSIRVRGDGGAIGRVRTGSGD